MDNHGITCQPYTALISRKNGIYCKETENLIGRIRNENITSYFNVIFIEDKEEKFISQNTIYLTSSLIQQLNVDVKQRVDVDLQLYMNLKPKPCESIKFYTFCKVITPFVSLI